MNYLRYKMLYADISVLIISVGACANKMRIVDIMDHSTKDVFCIEVEGNLVSYDLGLVLSL